MLQLAHNSKSGAVELVEVPTPVCEDGCVLVQTLASAVSGGTERNTVRVGRGSLVKTAASRPDLVRRVVSKYRRDGWSSTFKAVKDRIERTTALGYSSAGRVTQVGGGVDDGVVGDIKVGDIVACAGAGVASHAELVSVPRRLLAKVPEGVAPEEAAFTTIGAIALQGVRLGKVELGENVAVIGLGLVGQLTVQLLQASGCRILATDLDPGRVDLAAQHGADVAVTADRAERGDWDGGPQPEPGFDCVIVAADSSSSRPLELAASLARDKGRVVVLGLVRTEFPREEFYRKELELVVSRSTGPGRYDPSFEVEGIDYPYAYVRWTETRNMEAFLDLLSRRRISVSHLISHRFSFDDAPSAYRLLTSGAGHMGIVFGYKDAPVAERRAIDLPKRTRTIHAASSHGFGMIGCGSFARSILLPGLRRQGFRPVALAAGHGLSARASAEKFQFDTVCASADDVLARDDLGAVFIATPHAVHADLVCRALRAGKHVFVEKPLAISREQLEEVRAALEASSSILMVGFNRRFSPLAQRIRELLGGKPPAFSFHYRVNAGSVPAAHWILDPAHGGRIIGEACHFIDLVTFLAAAPLEEVSAVASEYDPAKGIEDCQIHLRFSGGTAGTISYITSNDAPTSKEHLEIWCGNKVIDLEDFEQAWFYDDGRDWTIRRRRQQKGHAEGLAAFHQAILAGGPPPIPFDQLDRTTLASIEAVRCLKTGTPFQFPRDENSLRQSVFSA